jgi:hypothetical protein
VSSARSLYRLNIVLAAIGALVVLGGTGVALARIDVGHVSVTQLLSYCHRLLPPGNPAALAVVGLGMLGGAVAARGLRSAVRLLRSGQRARQHFDVIGREIAAQTAVVVIDDERPNAFCAGLIRPKIYVSNPTLAALTAPQLRAVVAHEAHHAARRDPLRLWLLTVLADALFFLPVLRRLRDRYEALAELAADEAAVATVGERAPLAGALLCLGRADPPGVVGIGADRVDHLLGAPASWQLPKSLLLAGLVILAGLLAVILAGASATSAQHVSLSQLAANSCMFSMTALPAIGMIWLAYLGRRRIRAQAR